MDNYLPKIPTTYVSVAYFSTLIKWATLQMSKFICNGSLLLHHKASHFFLKVYFKKNNNNKRQRP